MPLSETYGARMKARLALCLVWGGFLLLIAPALLAEGPSRVRIIFDTDMAGDVDDVGALAMIHVLADREEIDLLACVVSSNNRHSAPCLDALNTWYGRPDLPIGVAQGTSHHCWTLQIRPERHRQAAAP